MSQVPLREIPDIQKLTRGALQLPVILCGAGDDVEKPSIFNFTCIPFLCK